MLIIGHIDKISVFHVHLISEIIDDKIIFGK